jgi:hypothetical protein
MATKRKTAQDYRKELADINIQKSALETRIISRARILCSEHPDIIVASSTYRKNILTGDYVKSELAVETALALIEIIEADLANQHPHKQTAIEGF